MANRCIDCKHDKGRCVGSTRKGSHQYCFEPKVMTRADRIRVMNDEELAEWLARTEISHAKEVLEIVGIPLDMTEKMVAQTKKETLDWIKQPDDGE